MNEIVNRGTARLKVDKIEVRDYNLQRLITDALIDRGYDVDITPINDDFGGHNGPQGQLLNVYEVRRI